MSSSTMAKAFVAPQSTAGAKRPGIFLAGSIEQGKADFWQNKMTEKLSDLPVSVFNPRRKDWNSNLRQDITEPKFKEQVDWELNCLEESDVVALYLQAGMLSPISLLEFGLYAREKKLIVCCEKDFWRRGNVQIVCHRFGITLVDTLDELIQESKSKLQGLIKE